jgi:hypothetical protein
MTKSDSVARRLAFLARILNKHAAPYRDGGTALLGPSRSTITIMPVPYASNRDVNGGTFGDRLGCIQAFDGHGNMRCICICSWNTVKAEPFPTARVWLADSGKEKINHME